MIRRLTCLVVVLMLGVSTVSAQTAATFPTKEVKIVVGWAAGGGTDLVGRAIAAGMEKELGKPVIVINREGGGGAVGFQEIASARPDGYTIGFLTPSIIAQKYAQRAVAKSDLRNYEHLGTVNFDPTALIVRADAPWKTLRDFVADARKSPGKYRIGDAGPASTWQVGVMALAEVAGIRVVHVPYAGGGPAVKALAGGEVDAAGASAPEAAPLAAAGKLRILALAGEKRDPIWPDIPTYREEGFDVVVGAWRVLAAPKGTPKEIVGRLAAAIEKAAKSPAYREFLAKAGLGELYLTPAETLRLLEHEDGRYRDLIQKAQAR